MIYSFVSHNHNPRLILLFAGWAMDSTPFRHLQRNGYDIAVIWDYRNLGIDWSFADRYKEICVIAWSLGVFAAASTIHSLLPRVTRMVAVNGTITPVDNRHGIPEAIYEGTAATLTPRNLLKFYRRMCGDAASMASFSADGPTRDFDELRPELEAVLAATYFGNTPVTDWDMAIIGRNDAIFPAVNQYRAWHRIGVPCKFVDAPHLMNFAKIIDSQIIDKARAGTTFDSGKHTYDVEAVVQRTLAEKMTGINAHVAAMLRRENCDIIEIGSGTGILTRMLQPMRHRHNQGTYTAIDIVDSAPSAEIAKLRFINDDAEMAVRRLPSQSADVIVSASTVQWFNSPAKFLRQCARILKPGGALMLSTYTRGNAAEISAATGTSLPLLTLDQWLGITPPDMTAETAYAYSHVLDFDTPRDVLRHMKLTGINALGHSNGGVVNPFTFMQRLTMALDGRYHITYHPAIIILIKADKI